MDHVADFPASYVTVWVIQISSCDPNHQLTCWILPENVILTAVFERSNISYHMIPLEKNHRVLEPRNGSHFATFQFADLAIS